jgi:preprotein translocase subunit YajC
VPFSSNTLIVLAASTGKGGSGLGPLIPFVLIAVVGYLLLVRPARARQRRALQNRTAIEPGVEVTTTAGLIATVVAVDDDTVTLEVAPGVHSRYVKAAIGRVNTPPEPEELEEPAEPETDAAADAGETDQSGDTPAGTGV